MENSSNSLKTALAPWLLLTVLANVIWMTSGSFGPDMSCWTNWSKSFLEAGYAGYNANYPPVFMHWLMLVAKIHSWLGIVLQDGPFLKSLVITPVVLAHLGLLFLVWKMAEQSALSQVKKLWLYALTALNPALLMDGPAWGQVDLLFALPTVVAWYFLVEKKFLFWVFPLLTLAVLLKLQTIALAPVLVALLWQNRAHVWKGIPLAILILVVAILPFGLAGNLDRVIQEAYLKSASTYPMASFNAANLWTLLGFNQLGDTRLLWDSAQTATGLWLLFTPKWLGMGLFVALSLGVMIQNLRQDVSRLVLHNSILVVMGFFVLLPSMHERYLLLAVPLFLLAAAMEERYLWGAALVSLAVFLNIAWVMPPHEGFMPQFLAAIIVLLFAVVGWGSHVNWSQWQLRMAHGTAWFGGLAVLIWFASVGWHLHNALREASDSHIPRGWTKASGLPFIDVHQDWGQMRMDKTVDGNPLTCQGKRYAYGFGTHAASTIRIPIPQGSQQFKSLACIDDEAKGGKVQFRILVDQKLRWTSDTVEGGRLAQEAVVALQGGKILTLEVDALGKNEFDHADWIMPAFGPAAP